MLGLWLLLLSPGSGGWVAQGSPLLAAVLYAVLSWRLLRPGSSRRAWLGRVVVGWALGQGLFFAAGLPTTALAAINLIGAGAAIGLTASLAAALFERGQVTSERLYISVSVYLLAGISFAALYQVIAVVQPEAFALDGPPWSQMQALTYFSFSTLTTLGYGDLSPATPLARSLAIVEATAGQLYLAILVARLVALELSHRSP